MQHLAQTARKPELLRGSKSKRARDNILYPCQTRSSPRTPVKYWLVTILLGFILGSGYWSHLDYHQETRDQRSHRNPLVITPGVLMIDSLLASELGT